MKQLTSVQLREIDRCFNWVCENIRIDNIPHQKVLFGSTFNNYLKGIHKIVLFGFPPNSNYEMADSIFENGGSGGE